MRRTLLAVVLLAAVRMFVPSCARGEWKPPDALQPGPYWEKVTAIENLRFTGTSTSGYDTVFDVYCAGLPPDARADVAETHQLVALSPDITSHRNQLTAMARRLASWGFVVLLPDLPPVE